MFLNHRSGRRITIHTGDFIQLNHGNHNGRTCRVDGVFVHERVRIKRIFVVVTFVKADQGEGEVDLDTILGCPILELGTERAIVGLPAIGSDQLWVLPKVGDQDKLLSIPYDVYFM
jgi:hypothetical protein